MVSVLIIWLYIFITSYITGFACINVINRKEEYRIKRDSSYVFAGLIFVTVFAQFFSLFYKVGLAANLILILICIACICLYKKELREKWNSFRLTVTPVKAGVVLVLLLIFAYGTANGLLHYDTGLYHAQSIRWIEEYGIVPGLGNLHSRLAYNSASFCLSALYSMSFWGGQSYHCVAGFMAFLLVITCMEVFNKKRIKKPQLSDFARIMGIYYLLIIFDEMISPASDYFVVLTVFYIIIRWLDLLEKEEKSYIPYALLSILCVFAVTIKLSGALILFLAIKPAVSLIKSKNFKAIGKFVACGVITGVPFLIRNVVLSGWFLYPFTALDWFSFDFKIPKGMAEYDAREIKVWGRGFSDVNRYKDTFFEWVPDWFIALDGINKVFLLLAAAGIGVLAVLMVKAVVRREKEMMDFLLVTGTITACFLFWLFNAPLVRYGCVFLWLTPILIWGYIYLKVSPGIDRYRIYKIAIVAVAFYKLFAFGKEAAGSASSQFFLIQKDYEKFETVSYKLHGYDFYYPKNGDRTGYHDFPASPVKAEDIFRSDRIEQGFKDVIH